MCFSAYLINKCELSLQHFIYLYIVYMHKLNYWFCVSVLKKNRNHCITLGLLI